MNLTLKEAAKWLRIHEQTLIVRARAGKIPGAAKPGKGWVFPEDGLRAYLNSLAKCPYIAGAEHGGSNSIRRPGDIENLLALPTARRRRNFTKNANRTSGAGTDSASLR